LLHAVVHPADIQDRDGGILVMATLLGMFPFLKKLFVDSGYKGPKFANALAKVLPHLEIEIVKRSDQVRSFVVLPKRWIVERTIAWLNRCRRLAKDWECLNRKALAFLRLASIRLMLRKLCNPAGKSPDRLLGSAMMPNSGHSSSRFWPCLSAISKPDQLNPCKTSINNQTRLFRGGFP
jgi:transposase